MSLRLFLAIPIPAPVADRLAALEVDVPGASWRTVEQYHLTLRFIGEVDEAERCAIFLRQLDPEWPPS